MFVAVVLSVLCLSLFNFDVMCNIMIIAILKIIIRMLIIKGNNFLSTFVQNCKTHYNEAVSKPVGKWDCIISTADCCYCYSGTLSCGCC